MTTPAPFSDEDFDGLAESDPDPWGWEAEYGYEDYEPSPYDGTYSEC